MKTDAIAQYGRGVSSQTAIEYASIAAAKVFNPKTRAACRTQNDEGCWFMTIIRPWKVSRLFVSGASEPPEVGRRHCCNNIQAASWQARTPDVTRTRCRGSGHRGVRRRLAID